VRELTTIVDQREIVIAIGGVPIRVHTSDPQFLEILQNRYTGFAMPGADSADFDFEVEIAEPRGVDPDAEVRVERRGGLWMLDRGDFHAEWDTAARWGRIRQTANPYSIDSVLRIVHSLVLAQDGGFLVHAASAVRNGKAFLFSGVSGAGKTTISRLAPPDATLLTDEISYVRKSGDGYVAFGTPFTGELAKVGENVSAPVAALYFLAQGLENRIDPIPVAEAGRTLLSNILFFAEDAELVQSVFDAACEFVSRVPVRRLTFMPDARVWDLVR
jgi:hypothetical protein